MSRKTVRRPSQRPTPAPKIVRAPRGVSRAAVIEESEPASSSAAAPTTERERVYRSEGQRLLCNVPGSLSAVANIVGTVKQSVGYWRTGEVTPNTKQRTKLEQHYGIAPLAWDQLPATSRPPIEPDDEDDDQGEDDAVDDELEEEGDWDPIADQNALIRSIRKQLGRKDMLPRERMQQQDMLSKAVVRKSKLLRERELLEDRVIREHPKWLKLQNALLGALLKHPEARRDLEDVFHRLLEEERDGA